MDEVDYKTFMERQYKKTWREREICEPGWNLMSFKIRLHPDVVKFLVDLNAETKERLTSGMKILETDPFKSRSHASTSPTGSENHLSPLRFQTFNRKVFWNRNEARWFSDPVSEVLHADIKKLKGTKKRVDLYRLRVGDYRVIYTLENNTIFVLEIITREKGYDWLWIPNRDLGACRPSRVSLPEFRFPSFASGARSPFHSLRSLKRTNFWRRSITLFLFLGSSLL